MEVRHANPNLRELLIEATQALARLDADRLEEMALSCQSLVRLVKQPVGVDGESGCRCGSADGQLAALRLALRATESNLAVLRGLCHGRSESLEYGPMAVRDRLLQEGHDGHH